jgi:hypothetical protein
MKQVKQHDSDDEDHHEVALSQQPDISDLPTIPDSEISPVAYIFEIDKDKDDIPLYQE